MTLDKQTKKNMFHPKTSSYLHETWRLYYYYCYCGGMVKWQSNKFFFKFYIATHTHTLQKIRRIYCCFDCQPDYITTIILESRFYVCVCICVFFTATLMFMWRVTLFFGDVCLLQWFFPEINIRMYVCGDKTCVLSKFMMF